MRSLFLPCMFALAALPCFAQDMIGVTFQGDVVRLDSTTGSVTPLATGQIGKNCLACTSDNRFWTTVRSGTSTANFQYHLAVIDPFTGAESLPFGANNVGDIRALAASPTGQLFGIRDTGGIDELVRFDLQTGAVTVIGPTGFTGIQALDFTGAGLRAWDITAGLLLISTQTGLATDPFPAVGGPAGMQFLATNPETNQTFVGRGALHSVSLQTGVATLTVNLAGNPDLRGAEFTTSRQQLIGQACFGSNGEPVCSAVPPFAAGAALNVQSNNHAAGAIGLQIVGFSETTYNGLPLPLNLDPIFGTNNCRLFVSADFTLLGITTPGGNMVVTINLPPSVALQQFYVQHAVLEPVPGGISFSNGLRVRPGL